MLKHKMKFFLALMLDKFTLAPRKYCENNSGGVVGSIIKKKEDKFALI